MSSVITKQQALQAIFNAFKWLTDNGLRDYSVEWLGEYPLLKVCRPRDILMTLEFLTDTKLTTFDPITYETFVDNYESVKSLFQDEQHIAFTYLEAPYDSPHYERKFLLPQADKISKLFNERYGSGKPRIVRADNIQSQGGNSIKESITNLISAIFLMLKGYMVRGDIGQGPDVIGFKTDVVKQLAERGFIEKEATLSQLSTIRVFGHVKERQRWDDSPEEITGIETESVNPKRGMTQLRSGYSNEPFRSTEFFDGKVLAVPFFTETLDDLDVLTYDDSDGIDYRRASKTFPMSSSAKEKKTSFINDHLHSAVRTMLLANLTVDEIRSMISARSLTMFQLLHEMQELEIEKILDKIEGVV